MKGTKPSVPPQPPSKKGKLRRKNLSLAMMRKGQKIKEEAFGINLAILGHAPRCPFMPTRAPAPTPPPQTSKD
jgi:hypothetical protein